MWLFLVLGVLTVGDADAVDPLYSRLIDTDTTDASRVMELARALEDAGHLFWAARCYSRVTDTADENARIEATLRLAKVELRQGKHRDAYDRLRRLVKSRDTEEARRLLRAGQNDDTRRQRQLLRTAGEHFEHGDYESARQDYLSALNLTPGQPVPVDFVPREAILPRIALCAAEIRQERAKGSAASTSGEHKPCTRCSAGFEKCQACGGKGTITRTRVFSRRGTVEDTRQCESCGSWGYRFCSTCEGFQFEIGPELPKAELATLHQVGSTARDVGLLKGRVKYPIDRIEKTVLRAKDITDIQRLRSVEPGYSLSRALRTEIETVPPTPAGMRSAQRLWRNVGDIRYRINFLLSYACEFSEFAYRFSLLRTDRNRRPLSFPPSDAERHKKSIPAAWLPAIDEEEKADWITVHGVLKSYAIEERGHAGKGVLTLDASPSVAFFTWLRGAEPGFEYLENSTWGRWVRGLSDSYPFDLHEKLAAITSDHHVLLMGRFLDRRPGDLHDWFEVWDVEVGRRVADDSLYRVLSEPVRISFPELSVSDLGSLLSWFGLAVEFADDQPTTRMSCMADGCTLAAFLDHVAAALQRDWYVDSETVVFTRRIPLDKARKMGAVTEQLAETRPGEISVTGVPERGADHPRAGPR